MGSGEEIPNRLTQARKTLSRDASIVGTSNINPGTKKLRINVGGQVHEPCASTLKNIPDSPLALMLKDNCKEQLDYDKETNELFFDRHPEVFSQVLDYFQTGKLHHPRNLCGPMFEEELKFWGIEEQQMETCCWHTYTHHRVTQDHLQVFKTQETTEDEPQRSNDLELGQQKDSSQWQTMKYRIWLMLDQPSSSSEAKFYAWISLSFVVISIITFTIYSLEDGASTDLQRHCNATKHGHNKTNATCLNETESAQSKSLSGQASYLWTITAPIEAICIIWFTFEFMIRAVFCPKKSRYFLSISTFLDAFALVTSYVLLLSSNRGSDIIAILNMSRYFRISRFFRVFYSLQVLGGTLRASAYHFLTLLSLLTIPVILFSSVVYYTEQNWGKEKSRAKMDNIPRTFWWAVVTMTTVGYGDAVPESIPGFFVGGAAAILGVIILSLTGSILGSTFEQYYNLAQTQLKIPNNRHNKIQVPFESLHDMAGIPLQEISKSSIKSCTTYLSGRDSGYGHSPVTKQRGRSVSHPPSKRCATNVERSRSNYNL